MYVKPSETVASVARKLGFRSVVIKSVIPVMCILSDNMHT